MQGIGAPHPIIMRIAYGILFAWMLVPIAIALMGILSEAQFERLRYVFATIFLLPIIGYLAWGIVAWHLSGKAMKRIDRYTERRSRRRVVAPAAS